MLIKNTKNQKYVRILRTYALACFTVFFFSCGDWLDVVPDGIATLDMAFNSRAQTLKYLATCYAWQPRIGGAEDPAILGSDELWTRDTQHLRLSAGFSADGLFISQGRNSAGNPVLGRWGSMYQAIRICNTFLENVDKTPDLTAIDREQWKAEVMVLKAYYHFILVQMYGPVPIIRENLPVDAEASEIRVPRDPVDSCFNYIVELIDEACEGNKLPYLLRDPISELGRITKTIALSLKAKVLVTAASPLYNCNNEQATLKNSDGTLLFSQDREKEIEKWEKAVVACREAIRVCEEEAGHQLYEFDNRSGLLTDTIALDVSLRNAFNLAWNDEIVWGNTQMVAINTRAGMIYVSMPKLNPQWVNSGDMCKFMSVPIKIATMFYTNHGVPLEEDITRDANALYDLRTATKQDNLYIRENRTTIDMHFDREPRFYAWLGFDGAIWYGADQTNDKNPLSLRYLGFKIGEVDATDGQGNYSGYIPKKYIPYRAQLSGINYISSLSYAWPLIRLSDLYLMYTEAINEAEGPNGPNSEEMFKYIDAVRARAGLETVQYSWDTYTNNQSYKTDKTAMRKIIQQERLIELCFEAQRFWEIRRWKTAPDVYKTVLAGWDMTVSYVDGTDEEVNRMMYTPQILAIQNFGVRDYFWPIKTDDINKNRNLVQNTGW